VKVAPSAVFLAVAGLLAFLTGASGSAFTSFLATSGLALTSFLAASGSAFTSFLAISFFASSFFGYSFPPFFSFLPPFFSSSFGSFCFKINSWSNFSSNGMNLIPFMKG